MHRTKAQQKNLTIQFSIVCLPLISIIKTSSLLNIRRIILVPYFEAYVDAQF